MLVTAILRPAVEGGYIAYSPDTGTTSDGDTIEHALANLREAVELYLEETSLPVMGAPLITTLEVAVA